MTTPQSVTDERAAMAIRDAGPMIAGRLWHELADSLRNPEFWAMSSWLDILVRARKSYLGLAWLLAPFLVYVFGVGAFFAGMYGRSIAEFGSHMALGLLVFRLLMSALTGSAGVFVSSQAFIMDGHMRLTDYVLQSIARSGFDLLIALPVVVAVLVLHGHVEPLGLLLAMPMLAVIILNVLWMSVAFALIGARFTDFGQALSTVSMFMFLLTPIIWYADTVPAGSVRAQLMRFNPLYHFVELFRAPILGAPVDPASPWIVAVMTIIGLCVATFLYRRYARFVPLWI